MESFQGVAVETLSLFGSSYPPPSPHDSYTSLITWPPAPFLFSDWLLPSITLLWWFSLSPSSHKRVSTGRLRLQRNMEPKS